MDRRVKPGDDEDGFYYSLPVFAAVR
jgi:hypothetical protein